MRAQCARARHRVAAPPADACAGCGVFCLDLHVLLARASRGCLWPRLLLTQAWMGGEEGGTSGTSRLLSGVRCTSARWSA